MVEQALHSNFASVASYSASEASMRSAGARWKKPAEGRLMTASLFNNELVIQLQSECPILSAIISKLKQDDSEESKAFCLRNKVLYKKKACFGQQKDAL